MGISFSNRRRNNHRRRRHHHYPPSPYYFLPDPPPPPPQHEYSYMANPTYLPTPPPAFPPPPPPLPPMQSCSYGLYNSYGYANTVSMGRYNYHYHYYPQQPPYFAGPTNGWDQMLNAQAMVGPTPPAPYVEHQRAKKVRNDVNVHKDTVRVEVDDLRPGQLLVSFVFDALFDGSFSITFFGKEEAKCELVPQFPEVYAPTRVPFYKGLGQKFRQPSGTGADLGFFALDDLSKPSSDDIYPLVISAETSISDSDELVHKQITQAVLEKTNDGSFRVKVVKQILWIEGVRYELRELYGIGSTNSQGTQSLEESDSGKECVICMTEPKDTAVLPCRHLCMCSECAKELRVQSNKCPICRHSIEELLEIKVDTSNEP